MASPAAPDTSEEKHTKPRANIGRLAVSAALLLIASAAGLLPSAVPVPVRPDPFLTSQADPPCPLPESSTPAPECGASIALAAGKAADKPSCEAAQLGLKVQGTGAQGCIAGELCSFTVRVSEPAQWPKNETARARVRSLAFKWAPMVILAGPSLVHAYVSALPAPLVPTPVRTQAFAMSYRAWEPGVYQASLVDQCWVFKLPGMTFPAYQNHRNLSLVATWQLVVHPRQALSSQQAQGSGAVHLAAGEGDSTPDPRPCFQSIPARWLRTRAPQAMPRAGGGEAEGGRGGTGMRAARLWENEYQWVPHGCARWLSVAQVAEALVRRNVREVAFIGDSHMRALMLHSAFLLSGAKLNNSLLGYHNLFSFPVVLQTGAPGAEVQSPAGNQSSRNTRQHVVQFQFYWIDGVYRNKEFGCKFRGQYSKRETTFPPLKGKPDVAVLGGGTWTAAFCDEPGMAYASHLEDFLAFYGGQFASKKVAPSQVIFMGIVPRPYCPGHVHDVHSHLLQFVIEVARNFVTNHGFSFFNPLEVASPMFHRTCEERDPHYSCLTDVDTAGRVAARGFVGEAMTWTFLQFLASSLR